MSDTQLQGVDVKPLGDRVIVRPKTAVKERGGLIIPEMAKEKPQEGTIVAVGEGKRRDDGLHHPLRVKVGDPVLYGRYAGFEIDLDGEQHIVMHEDDIVGILVPKA